MKYFIAIALALTWASETAVAESPQMEHVLVSVPLHKKTAETAMPVTVISGEALHRAAASTLGETLDSTPGLANASFGPGVGQPVIRGQQGSRVTVLQNGTSSADASNLSADHAVAVEAMLAQSIEVLRGPATLLYGGGAIGGVVNVVDGRIPTSEQEGFAGGTEYRHDTASNLDTVVLRADLGSGAFAWHIDALYRDWVDLEIPGAALKEDSQSSAGQEPRASTDDVIDNTSGRTKNFTFGGSYHFEDGFIGLAASRLENEYGIPSAGHAREEVEHDTEQEGVRLDVIQNRYDGALHWHKPVAGLEILRGFLTYTDYGHDEIEPGGDIGTQFSNETWEGRLELVHETAGPFHGVFGLQVKGGTFSALGEEAFVPKTDSSSLGVFWLEELHWGSATYEVGLRLDRDDVDPESQAPGKDFLGVSASGSAQWVLGDGWLLGVGLSRAERAPVTEELYSNIEAQNPSEWVEHAATGSIELGDPDLDKEVSLNLDLSARWSQDAHFVEVALFYNDFSDYINLRNSSMQVADVPVLQYGQDDAEFYGVEISSEFDIGALGPGSLTLGLFGDTIRGTLKGGGSVPRLPPNRLGAQLSWDAESLAVWLKVLSAGSQNRPGENEEATSAYTRWDIGSEYQLTFSGREVTLFAEVKNITDEEIRLSTSFLRDVAPQAGVSLEMGVRISW